MLERSPRSCCCLTRPSGARTLFKRYHVCGPASWSIHALAALYEAALSLPAGSIACKEGMSEAAFADHLETNAGFPRWLAVAVAHNHMFWAEGKLDYASSEPVLQLHPVFRTMEAWVQEHARRSCDSRECHVTCECGSAHAAVVACWMKGDAVIGGICMFGVGERLGNLAARSQGPW